MRKYSFIITLSLLVVIVLPVSFFVVRHYSSLTENEEAVQEVFEKQIETILYSLNQQTENYLALWVNKLDLPLDPSGTVIKSMAGRLLDNNPAIHAVRFYSPGEVRSVLFSRQDSIHCASPIPSSSLTDRLISFKENNYQRIEALRDGDYTHLIFLMFNSAEPVFITLSVHMKTFIEQNLGAAIQQVAGESFVVSVFDTLQGKTVYSFGQAGQVERTDYRKASVYMPGYVFSIHLQAATINELVYERTRRDNYIFLGLSLFMLAGLIIVIGSIRKEIRLSEMKSEFVSNVSHEIRTPLALISMYAETLLLKRVKGEVKQKEYLGVICFEANRLTTLVNRILAFSKTEGNKRKYHLAETDLNTLLAETNEAYLPYYRQHQVEVSIDLSEPPALVMADHEAVSECISNLIDNAIKYGRETGKQIFLTSRMENSRVVIEVKDNGVGISKKYHRKIFDKFFRVTQGNLAHAAKGSGLGLNMVQKIIKAHGGKVTVQSEVNRGSCFCLYFPVKRNHNGKNSDH